MTDKKIELTPEIKAKLEEAKKNVKKLSPDDLEKVAGGAKTLPDAEISPVEPKVETQAVKTPIKIGNPKETAVTDGDVILPEIS